MDLHPRRICSSVGIDDAMGRQACRPYIDAVPGQHRPGCFTEKRSQVEIEKICTGCWGRIETGRVSWREGIEGPCQQFVLKVFQHLPVNLQVVLQLVG